MSCIKQFKDLESSFSSAGDAAGLSLVAPMSVAELGAEAAYLQAAGDIGRRIESQQALKCERHFSCGVRTVALRDAACPRGKGFAVVRRCKRCDCGECRRRLLVNHLLRVGSVVLHGGPESATPRSGLLHVALVPWRRWRAVARSMSRYCPGAGYARVRHDIGLVMVVCEEAFPGSTALVPGAAAGLLAGAIEKADKVRQAVAWCGAWGKKRPVKKFELVKTKLDLDAALVLAEQYGAKCRRLNRSTIGASWIFAPDADPARIEEFYARLACLSSASVQDMVLRPCPSETLAVPEARTAENPFAQEEPVYPPWLEPAAA